MFINFKVTFFDLQGFKNEIQRSLFAQLAGAVEYTELIYAEG